MRRTLKWIGGVIAVLVALPVLLLLAANTSAGRQALVWLTPKLTGDTVRLAGPSGRFPDALRVAHAELRDAQGAYATVDDFALDWSPLQLLRWRVVIDRLEAAHIDAIRMPVGSSSSGGSGVMAPVSLGRLHVARLDIGPALAGTAAAVALDGAGELNSATAFQGNLTVRDLGGPGIYTVTGSADAARLTAKLHASEPAHGLVATLAGLPDLGGLALDATLDGPRQAVVTQLTLTAGELHATVGGTLDLEHSAADLSISAGAPAMEPRPGIRWQAVAIDARVHGPFATPDASGKLRIDGLAAGGASISAISADVAGNAGRIRLNGELTGLRIPGPNPDLLAADPLTITADALLDAPSRPVHLTLRHRLLTADADALTGAQRRVDASLKLADLAPYAAMGQVALQGGLALTLHAAIQGDTTTLAADGTLGVTGGQPQASALVGQDGRFSLAATVRGSDVTLSKAEFTGRGGTVQASGKFVDNHVDLAWSLAVHDLAAAESRLAGQVQAKGSVSGAMDDIAMAANIDGTVAAQGMSSGPLAVRIEASGLPAHPNGRITARGALLDAPVDVSVTLKQAGEALAVDIERATWKSLQADGALQLPTATMVPSGELRVAMTRLADLTPLVGQPVAGSVKASFAASSGAAKPVLDAKVDVESLRFGGLGGTLHVTANGTQEALDVKLAAVLADLQGAPAQLSATARVDAVGQSVSLATLQAEWRQQTMRLLAPARIGFADGVSIDRVRLGLRQAVVEVSGRAGSALDITASVRNLPADLAAMFAPDYAADGTVEADARITGSAARPTGRVRVNATGLRVRSGPGRAMPPVGVTATADLNGADAQIDVRVTGGKSRLGVTGRAPLNTAGAVNLRATGALDLAMLDPIVAAGGRRVRGQVALDGSVTGTATAPNIAGTARLTDGEVQDYGSGLHLSGMTARIEGNGTTLRIAQFSAKAGQGSIGASGTIDLGASGMPVDLTLTAKDAQPLASDLMTAVLDANLTVRGEVAGQLTVGGNVRIQRAEIRIPERMPAAIAVLPIRQPGAKAAPPPAAVSVIALNIALNAPGQIYVRGRGLEAEFGGAMQIGGTVATPQTSGALTLRRGFISLAGRSLDFAEGQITFNGGSITDPALRLVSNSTSGSVTATLTIGGTAHNPKITLSSVPSLPQDEVLAQLLFGSGTGKLGAFEVAEIAAALATLTGAGGGIGDPLDKVRQGLGLDRLSVRNGANGSPALEAGRYIAPRVYLGAKQSASGGTQATVQYDITKGLKLEATAGAGGGSATGAAGSSNGTSVGVTYQFEY